MRRPAWLLVLASCAPVADDPRDGFVINALAEDNYVWARRDPDLVADKLAKMQRGPFEWLRGTAGVYWRDLTTPGTDRAVTAFGDPASARVLVQGDPHPENIGTFRAADGTMIVEYNDFDAAGYGPYEGDLRRLAAGVIVASASEPLAEPLARAVAEGYAGEIDALAAGQPAAPIGRGAEPYLDKLIDKAVKDGDAGKTIDSIAPIVDGARQITFGDLAPVADDGVIEKRLVSVGAEAAGWIDQAVDAWRTTARPPVDAAFASIKLRARRIGAGVSSYPALRYYVVIEGPTTAPEDDRLLELKEERDGVIVPGIPRLDAAEWDSPADRVVDAQRRFHARPDADVLLGSARVGGLALRVHEEGAYQRPVTAADLAELAAGDAVEQTELVALAARFGALLARAHGAASTEDGVAGWTVIAPLIAGREPAFLDEVATFALADAAQVVEDHARMKDRDLAALVVPVGGR